MTSLVSMAIFPPPFDPNRQTPNGPFYSTETWSVAGPLGPLVLGSGLDVSIRGVLSASGSGSGTVTSVATGAGLIGGPITTTGTIALTTTGVTPAAYTNANITVDAYGRITLAANGSSGGVTSVTGTAPISVTAGTTPVVSIAAASTTAAGAVQLNNTTASTSTSLALTAAQGKNLQDQIDALAITSNLTLAGTLNTATGNLVTVTTAGTTAGFVVGSPLPAAAAGNAEHFVIVTVATTSYTPPGGVAVQTHVGDWFLSSGTAWNFLDVGFDPPYASTTVAGVVQLATNAQTQTGTDATLAVTPAGAAATYVPLADYATKGDILAATGASTPVALPVGTNSQVLYANSACASGLEWGTQPITCLDFDAKGDLLVGAGSDSFATLGVGTDGQALLACSTATNGVCWGTAGGASDATPTSRGVLYGCSGTTTTGVGCEILTSLTTGACNTAVGCSVLSSIVNGSSNTAVGYKAGSSVIGIGSWNVAMGSLALGNATGTGNIIGNTAIGMCSLSALTIGTCNVAVGACSMRSQTSGSSNVAIGTGALFNSTEGIGNVAIGNSSLLQSTTAGFNIGIGYASMQANTTGTCNIGIGICSHDFLDGGCNNVALGFRAGANLSTGCYNVSIGDSVCLASATGSCQLAIGFSATENWLTGDSTKAIKPGAGIIDSASSTGTAGQVLTSNGANAICWGAPAIPCACITAKGALITGTAADTLSTLPVGGDGCVLVACSTASRGICWGNPAFATTNPSTRGTVVGCTTTNATYLTALGAAAIFNNANGTYLAAVGTRALYCNTTGRCNNALGVEALFSNTTGCNNTALGMCSLFNSTTGCGNVMVGGMNSTGTYSPVFDPTVENDRVMIGSTATTNAYVQVAWTVTSDARDKTNVTALPVGLDFVNQLNPVSFQFKESRECDTAIGPVRYGFLAQEVLEAEGENPVIVDTEVPEKLKITNDNMNAVFVKAIQELSAQNKALEARIAQLEGNG